MEFKAFSEIKRLSNVRMTVTQKIHGTNAQVSVFERTSTDGVTHEPRLDLRAGSRNRWLFPEDDNFGFASFVDKNKEAFLKLGIGVHYGEWAGPGINSGEGLTEKTFVLFDPPRYESKELPPQTVLVPILYEGPLDLNKVSEIMEDLKANGSKLQPGFMRPEGCVVQFHGSRFKVVFDSEETQWKKPSNNKVSKETKILVDYTHLCQPIRLEKLLTRDETYIRNYPESLPSIVKDYVADLIKEGQIKGDRDEIRAITKGATGQIFKFIKASVNV